MAPLLWCYTWVLTLRPAPPPWFSLCPLNLVISKPSSWPTALLPHTHFLLSVSCLIFPVCSWPQSPVLGLALSPDWISSCPGWSWENWSDGPVCGPDGSVSKWQELPLSVLHVISLNGLCILPLTCEISSLLFSFIPCFFTPASVSLPLEAFKNRLKARVLEGCSWPQACIWQPLHVPCCGMAPCCPLACGHTSLDALLSLPSLCLLPGTPEWPTEPCRPCPQPHFLPASHLPLTSVFVCSLQFFLWPPPTPRCSPVTDSFLTFVSLQILLPPGNLPWLS